ncbi:uncharacterized protein I206_102166 [Kwoniella pini CBS 10737]|uniref:Uncharacterized protein n=1 Tax=Kwoniella pini CBS 10737 TaxID=1296096 RepID=A0A1B9HUL5_9TREE|nr:uncharacterized protein I206_06739 [Kwoniella pini CBS 10737]OCF46965.1 hypothetical protein I206_06739 [Kwoniella pini CBS 10737]
MPNEGSRQHLDPNPHHHAGVGKPTDFSSRQSSVSPHRQALAENEMYRDLFKGTKFEGTSASDHHLGPNNAQEQALFAGTKFASSDYDEHNHALDMSTGSAGTLLSQEPIHPGNIPNSSTEGINMPDSFTDFNEWGLTGSNELADNVNIPMFHQMQGSSNVSSLYHRYDPNSPAQPAIYNTSAHDTHPFGNQYGYFVPQGHNHDMNGNNPFSTANDYVADVGSSIPHNLNYPSDQVTNATSAVDASQASAWYPAHQAHANVTGSFDPTTWANGGLAQNLNQLHASSTQDNVQDPSNLGLGLPSGRTPGLPRRLSEWPGSHRYGLNEEEIENLDRMISSLSNERVENQRLYLRYDGEEHDTTLVGQQKSQHILAVRNRRANEFNRVKAMLDEFRHGTLRDLKDISTTDIQTCENVTYKLAEDNKSQLEANQSTWKLIKSRLDLRIMKGLYPWFHKTTFSATNSSGKNLVGNRESIYWVIENEFRKIKPVTGWASASFENNIGKTKKFLERMGARANMNERVLIDHEMSQTIKVLDGMITLLNNSQATKDLSTIRELCGTAFTYREAKPSRAKPNKAPHQQSSGSKD